MLRKAGLIALVLLMLCTGAAAEKLTGIDVSCAAVPQAGTLHAWDSGRDWTLFLPGGWDASTVTVELSGAQSLQTDRIAISHGDTVDFTPLLGEKLNLEGGGTLTVYQGSALPALYVTVDAAELKKAHQDKDHVITTGTAAYVEKDGSVSYSGALAGFKGRGNSTFAHEKKPYQIKLAEKADLSGMGAHKTWILLANHLDLSLLRNQITLGLARELGVPFAVECRQVDLYVNGDYAGLYLLTEKVQIGSERVEITDLEKATEKVNDLPPEEYKRIRVEGRTFTLMKYFDIPNDPEDITGGYLLEIEKAHRLRNEETNGFANKLGISVVIKEPEACSRAQMEYIANLFNDFHNAIYAPDGVNPDTGRHYTEYIDVDSFAAKYVIEEFCKNYDAFSSSQFFFKDSDRVDGRLVGGPLWDYDLCYGNLRINGFNTGSQPEKEYVTTVKLNNNIYWLLHRHEDFMDKVRARFHGQLAPAVRKLLGEENGAGLRSIQAMAEEIALSARMNFVRWPEKRIKGYYTASGTTHDASVAYLQEFIARRLEDMEAMWPDD